MKIRSITLKTVPMKANLVADVFNKNLDKKKKKLACQGKINCDISSIKSSVLMELSAHLPSPLLMSAQWANRLFSSSGLYLGFLSSCAASHRVDTYKTSSKLQTDYWLCSQRGCTLRAPDILFLLSEICR